MSFVDLNVQFSYRSDVDDIATDFLVPVLSESISYKRSVGYFSTSSLISLSVGLCKMAQNGGKVEIICSPQLSKEDIEAVNLGYKTREKAITEALALSIAEPKDYYESERLNLIVTMIAMGILDIKIAFMETDTGINIYHEKIALFEDKYGNKIGFNGSLNESENGLKNNFESIDTYCSWKNESEEKRVERIEENFGKLWNDKTKKLRIVPFPKIVLGKLMTFKKGQVNFELDNEQYSHNGILKKDSIFHVPEDVTLREYQKDAVSGWINQNYQGIFSMSTGSGKSYTALACMVDLAKKLEEKLAVFIVCPYIHLVGQWEEDEVNWACTPIIAHSKSPDKNWEQTLIKAYKRFRNSEKPFVCITTNDTFASEKIQNIITRFNEEQNVLLIVDEAHNFGSKRLSELLPENIKYRIALSATIKRHMDKQGTDKLFNYFGNECIVYDLERAIKDGALCKYKYYPIPVVLEMDELEEYSELTEKIKKFVIEENGKIKISEEGKLLVFKRSRLLAKARQKIPTLLKLMEKYKDDNSILVYSGASTMEKSETGELTKMIDEVTDSIKKSLDMRVHKFTAEETLDERQEIKHYFEKGLYQVITAIKCLDEGVNIPGIKTAFIMSSSRNPKEFIQRRGRLLRRSKNKKYAEIYDFITLPRDLSDVVYGDYESDRTIILGELFRMNEFAKLAENRNKTEVLITEIMNAYGVFFDIDEENKKMEEYYDG